MYSDLLRAPVDVEADDVELSSPPPPPQPAAIRPLTRSAIANVPSRRTPAPYPIGAKPWRADVGYPRTRMTPHAVAGSPPAPSRVATTTRFGRVRRPARPAAPPRTRLTPINPLVVVAEVGDPDRDAAVPLELARLHADADVVEARGEEYRPVLVRVEPGAHRAAHGRRLAVSQLEVLAGPVGATQEA